MCGRVGVEGYKCVGPLVFKFFCFRVGVGPLACVFLVNLSGCRPTRLSFFCCFEWVQAHSFSRFFGFRVGISPLEKLLF